MIKYIIQAQLIFECEVEDLKKAEEEAGKKFQEIEKLDVKVENARFVDRASGYFVRV